MQFNSIEFLFFLPIVFLIYWFIIKQRKAQNLFILIVSYIFYGCWNWRFLVLIAFTSFCSFFSGKLIDSEKIGIPGIKVDKKRFNKIVSVSNIIINLLILCVFKYYNFFISGVGDFFETFGISLPSLYLDIILPVGISFYTFQALSYSIDVYRKKIKASDDIVAFFAFISFFPQLVAGPIERASNLLPQFLKDRKFDYNLSVDGLRQILWGLFKKMVVADNCARFANNIFNLEDYSSVSGTQLMIGALMFTFQIYGDFSGYSDIAIGTSKLFGFNLKRNFNVPYFSRDIAEFWRRWHISLNTWFRDYIYIPLGGSKEGKYKAVRNAFVIFLVSGLWHGANMTFVFWGLYHAVLFSIVYLRGTNRKFTDNVAAGRLLPNIKELFEMASTFILVAFGWIFFRADSMSRAYDYISNMIMNIGFKPEYMEMKTVSMAILILLVIEWLQRDNEHGLSAGLLQKSLFKIRLFRYGFYYLLILIILFFQGIEETFIYFQF